MTPSAGITQFRSWVGIYIPSQPFEAPLFTRISLSKNICKIRVKVNVESYIQSITIVFWLFGFKDKEIDYKEIIHQF